MTNHFRTLLLNLSYGNDPNEHIPKEFTARQLSSELLSIYQILFPASATRADKERLGLCYLELIRGAGLESAFTLVDDRITYNLDGDFDYFGNKSIDVPTLYNSLLAKAGTIDSLLSKRPVADTYIYDNIWHKHPNLAYRVAGLIVAYVLRLS